MRRRIALAGALALVASQIAAATALATPTYQLRVEAPGATLDPGTRYSVRNVIQAPRGVLTGSGTCVRGPGKVTLAGRTAMGLFASAANGRKRLRPLYIAESGFGRRVCRSGPFTETDSPFSGWLFRHNHAAPPFSAELIELRKTDEVLWVFANFGSGENTGDELVLRAPARTQPGLVRVTVEAITFDGVTKPAPNGTIVIGGNAPVTTVGGAALVPLRDGRHVLRAFPGSAGPTDIPSNLAKLCAKQRVKTCPKAPGRRFVGTNKRDNLKGTKGPDKIWARGGKDKIRVRGGGKDRVNCGKGKDVVIADKKDKVRRCERVLRHGKKVKRGGRAAGR